MPRHGRFEYHTWGQHSSWIWLQPDELMVVLAPVGLVRVCSEHDIAVDERQRLHRFRLIDDKNRYLLAHSLKRRVLAGLLDCPAWQLEFTTAQNGKPLLRDNAIRFNLSHSGDWVALACTRHAEVGVDVEVRRRFDYTALLDYLFDDAGTDGATVDADGFYAAWTLKEAIAKVSGRGLSMPLRRLRLETLDACLFRGDLESSHWYAYHHRLDDADLAVASETPWSSLRIVQLACPEKSI